MIDPYEWLLPTAYNEFYANSCTRTAAGSREWRAGGRCISCKQPTLSIEDRGPPRLSSQLLKCLELLWSDTKCQACRSKAEHQCQVALQRCAAVGASPCPALGSLGAQRIICLHRKPLQHRRGGSPLQTLLGKTDLRAPYCKVCNNIITANFWWRRETSCACVRYETRGQ